MAPKYEVVMLAIAGPRQTVKIKEFLKDVSQQLWATGAVIADLKSWGSRPLAYRIRQHSVNHYHAQYLGLHLYCSPKALEGLQGAHALLFALEATHAHAPCSKCVRREITQRGPDSPPHGPEGGYLA